MLTYCDVIDTRAGRQQLWRHNDRVVAMDAFLAQWNRKFITAQWSTENTSWFNFFVYFFFNFVIPVFQHGASLVFIIVVIIIDVI